MQMCWGLLRLFYNVIFLYFSKSLSRLTEDFVCSVVLGDDMVPRLGIVTMETLKCNMLRCIKDSNKPKVSTESMYANIPLLVISIIMKHVT